MSATVEIWLNGMGGDLMAEGEVHAVDESFDHDFGRESKLGLEVRNVKVLAYINGGEADITYGFKTEANKRHFERIEEQLLRKARSLFNPEDLLRRQRESDPPDAA